MNGLANQQGKADEASKYWLAGFFDGEGSVGFGFNQKTRRIIPMVVLCNTDAPILSDVVQILEKLQVGHYIRWRQHISGSYGRLPIWNLSIMGFKRCRTFLLAMIPYMRIKRGKAELVWDFLQSRASQSQKAPYTDYEWSIFQRVRKLNGKATKDASRKPSEALRRTQLPRL